VQHPAQAAETAAHLVDRVLPRLPVRQWVLSLPKRLRHHLHHDREALNTALRIFLDQIERHLRAHSPGAGPDARAGAVAFIHRFGASLNLHTHFHVCVIDGLFEPDPRDRVRFFALEELDAHDAEALQAQVRRRILRAFVRRGILDKEDRRDMEQGDHGGGFSLDASVRIEANGDCWRRAHRDAASLFRPPSLDNAVGSHLRGVPPDQPVLHHRLRMGLINAQVPFGLPIHPTHYSVTRLMWWDIARKAVEPIG
jgi:hypothetical protein